MKQTYSVLAEINAEALFEDESVNWHWCVHHANFAHRDACEFVVHIGTDADEPDSYYQNLLKEMTAYGCTPEFLAAYTAAKESGAIRVLFYV